MTHLSEINCMPYLNLVMRNYQTHLIPHSMGYLKKKRHIWSFLFNFNSIKFELFQKGMPILSQAWICLPTTQYLDPKLREGSNFIKCLLWFQTLFNNGEKVRLSMFKNHKADSHSLMILIIKTMQIQHSMAYIWILKSEKKVVFLTL